MAPQEEGETLGDTDSLQSVLESRKQVPQSKEWEEFTQLSTCLADLSSLMDSKARMSPHWSLLQTTIASIKKKAQLRGQEIYKYKMKQEELSRSLFKVEEELKANQKALRDLEFAKWSNVNDLKASIKSIEDDITLYTIENVQPLAPLTQIETPIPALAKLICQKFARLEEFNFLLRKRLGSQKMYRGQQQVEKRFGDVPALLESHKHLEEENSKLRRRELRFATLPLLKRRQNLARAPPAFLCALIMGLQNQLTVYGLCLEDLKMLGVAADVNKVLETYGLARALHVDLEATPPLLDVESFYEQSVLRTPAAQQRIQDGKNAEASGQAEEVTSFALCVTVGKDAAQYEECFNKLEVARGRLKVQQQAVQRLRTQINRYEQARASLGYKGILITRFTLV
jgi:hypothetical protein